MRSRKAKRSERVARPHPRGDLLPKVVFPVGHMAPVEREQQHWNEQQATKAAEHEVLHTEKFHSACLRDRKEKK
ncbi:MAG: hypothetical protein ACRDYX_10250 [Egibacteraceae bacterium]